MTSPYCSNGCGPETAAHLYLNCKTYDDLPGRLPRVRDGHLFREALTRCEAASCIAGWVYDTGRIEMYGLSKKLEADIVAREKKHQELIEGLNMGIPPRKSKRRARKRAPGL